MKKFFLPILLALVLFPTFPTSTYAVGLTIKKPATGDILALGKDYLIEWTSSSSYSSKMVAIVLVPRGPDCLYTIPACEVAAPEPYVISAAAPNTGSYFWTVPADLGSSFQGEAQIFMVINDTDIFGESDIFTVGSEGGTDIIITSPTSAVSWPMGTQQAISWTGGEAPYKITLEPYIACITTPCTGSPIYTLASKVDTGSFIWTVGQDASGVPIPVGPYRLHVVDTNGGKEFGSTIVQIVGTPSVSCVGREGFNIKYANSPAIYFIKNCKKQIYSSPAVFSAWSQSFSSVLTVLSSEIFENDGQVKLPSGLLVKGSGPTVFLIDSGYLRPFTSLSALTSRGYVLAKVKTFSDSDLAAHPRGWDLN